ncbi:CwfJ C-terminus 1-domain-containing protein-like protein [Auriculariales sp. MPI-PUGE-AT-0066]|nr:CwfJ C-terminus 1-domain-containing protein-like protein [Auriculariales sp. MPI-PUGE-AT-0066]
MTKHKREREKHDRPSSSHKHKKRRVQDDNDDDWEESNVDIATGSAQAAPSSQPVVLVAEPPKPAIEREEWMRDPTRSSKLGQGEDLMDGYGDEPERAPGQGVDFFAGLGTERKRKEKTLAPDPANMPRSSKELNPHYGNPEAAKAAAAETPKKATIPGGPGSQWRMMRLRRVYEQAEEEGRPVEEVAKERYSSMDEWTEAVEERRILDERAGRRSSKGFSSSQSGPPSSAKRSFMFTDDPGSGASSRSASFRRPGADDSRPTTPMQRPGTAPRAASSFGANTPTMTVPTLHSPAYQPVPSAAGVPSQSELNQMQAKVLKAKLLGDPGAEQLEKEYDEARDRAESAPRLAVLPTHDIRGQIYDVGSGKNDAFLPGNRKQKQGTAADDHDKMGVMDMLRQERFGAGSGDQKDVDAQLTRAIMSDAKFENNLEYMDDNADRLGRKKMKTDAMKRMFAIQDHAKTQKVLSSCQFCPADDNDLPRAPVISMGTRCYLSCTQFEELLPGHCLIVPLQHHLSMLEGDDDLWEEVKNFMKCLMRMFAADDKGVMFYETVMNLKQQRHTFIECVPVPWSLFEDLPAYFKEGILASESEWSQHRKVIDFGARPGGFRRAMVPNLPYFAIQWDYKGEKGYGHVIEGVADAGGAGDDPDGALDEASSNKFPRYFAAEIIGNVLDLPPRLWRHPRKVDGVQNRKRVQLYKKQYDSYDWTPMLREQQ